MLHIPHLYIDDVFRPEGVLSLNIDATHRLQKVMRLKEGEEVRIFNGRQGLWKSRLIIKKRALYLNVESAIGEQPLKTTDLTLFVPIIKHQRLALLIRHVVEMGVNRLVPMTCEYSAPLYNWRKERIFSIVIGALEQSKRLSIPEISQPQSFENILLSHDGKTPIFACREYGLSEKHNFLDILSSMDTSLKASIMIGPEAGFSKIEHQWIEETKEVFGVNLGRYILRSETAAIAAISIWNAFQSKLE